MPALPDRRRLRLRRDTIKILLATALFSAFYFGVLAWQNYRAESYYERLRQTDPLRYLDDVRKNEGFSSYLDKFRLLEGYYVFKAAVPSFLVGRWTMRAAPQRVVSGATFADCSDPIVFEKGLIELGDGQARVQIPINYRIIGQGIVLSGPSLPAMEVSIVSYGAAIDHLELVPPGRHKTLYAYRCGN